MSGPSANAPQEVTRILSEASKDPHAAARLLPLVYNELRALAKSRLQQFGGEAGQTLEPTALVHEAYVRLVGKADPSWNGRGHFFAAAAQAMRNILVDSARRKRSVKHGGEVKRLDLDEAQMLDDGGVYLEPAPMGSEGMQIDILALDAALTKLAEVDERKAQVVMLRYFSGLTPEETALALDISLPTVFREWKLAKALLMLELEDKGA